MGYRYCMDPQTTKFRNIAFVLLAFTSLVYTIAPQNYIFMALNQGPTLQLIGSILSTAIATAAVFAFAVGVAMLAAHFVRLHAHAER